MSDYRSERERLYTAVNAPRPALLGDDDAVLPKADVHYLLNIAVVAADQIDCKVIHGDKPRGFTCLDQLSEAADFTKRFGARYRAEILDGQHLCDGCKLRAALGDF
jgi:hypothetical protein